MILFLNEHKKFLGTNYNKMTRNKDQFRYFRRFLRNGMFYYIFVFEFYYGISIGKSKDDFFLCYGSCILYHYSCYWYFHSFYAVSALLYQFHTGIAAIKCKNLAKKKTQKQNLMHIWRPSGICRQYATFNLVSPFVISFRIKKRHKAQI